MRTSEWCSLLSTEQRAACAPQGTCDLTAWLAGHMHAEWGQHHWALARASTFNAWCCIELNIPVRKIQQFGHSKRVCACKHACRRARLQVERAQRGEPGQRVRVRAAHALQAQPQVRQARHATHLRHRVGLGLPVRRISARACMHAHQVRAALAARQGRACHQPHATFPPAQLGGCLSWTVGRDSSQHVSATQCRACPLLCSLHRCMCPSCVLQQTSQHAQHAACLATRRPACRTPKDKIANALLHVPLMCPAANIKCITFHACALHMPCSKHSSMHSMRPA